MSDARLDAERLAMLLDGRLSGEERERLLAELAADPEAMADLAAAAAALRDEGASATAPVASPGAASGTIVDVTGRSPDRQRQPAWRRWRPLLAAASLIVAAAVGVGIWQATRTSALEGTFAAIAAVRPAGSLPDDWSEPPWARTRGADPQAPHPATSAMIGARVADLELATRQAPERVPPLARTVSELVGQLPGSGPALARWEAALADSVSGGAALAAARESIEPLVEPAHYELGAVLEGIRLALVAGDDAAVRSLAGRLTILGERTEVNAPARDAAVRLGAMLESGATTARNRDERLRAVEAAFRALL